MRKSLALASAATLAVTLAPPASAGPDSPVYPVSADPLGKSYREWSSIYAEWELEIRRGQHPVIHPESPRNCEVVQGMAMLGARGTGAGGCTVPEGVPIMSMPTGYECSQAEGDGSTFRKLRRCAVEGWNSFVGPGKPTKAFRLWVDGQRVPQRLDTFKIVTTPTVADLPEHNIIDWWYGDTEDFPAQTTKQMSVVVSHIIRPLSGGWHRIRFVMDYHKGEGPSRVVNWRVRVTDDDKVAQ